MKFFFFEKISKKFILNIIVSTFLHFFSKNVKKFILLKNLKPLLINMNKYYILCIRKEIYKKWYIKGSTHIYTYIHVYAHISIYMYSHIYVCICVYTYVHIYFYIFWYFRGIAGKMSYKMLIISIFILISPKICIYICKITPLYTYNSTYIACRSII